MIENFLSVGKEDRLKFVLVFIIMVVLVVAIDMITGDGYEGRVFSEQADQYHYLSMAENGILDNPDLVSPMAYRFGVTTTAATISYLSSISIVDSYRLISIVSNIFQLLLVFILADFFTKNSLKSMFITLVVAFSFFNLRFLLFDFIRPDPIAYLVMLLVFILVFKKHLLSAALVSTVGLMFREFFIAPILTIILLYIEEYKWRKKTEIFLIIGFTVAMIVIPRAIIPISKSYQFINSQNYHSVLIGALRDTNRMINVLLAIVGYMLPTLLLLTLRRALVLVFAHRKTLFVLAPYTLVVFGLTIYGGTDLGRFAAYLFIPQIICLALIMNEKVQLWEFIYVLFVVIIYNQLFKEIPLPSVAFSDYLQFGGPYASLIDASTYWRYSMIAYSLVGIWAIRFIKAKLFSNNSSFEDTAPA